MAESARPYQDALRWGRKRADATLLLVPDVSQADFLSEERFVAENRVGAIALRPDDRAAAVVPGATAAGGPAGVGAMKLVAGVLSGPVGEALRAVGAGFALPGDADLEIGVPSGWCCQCVWVWSNGPSVLGFALPGDAGLETGAPSGWCCQCVWVWSNGPSVLVSPYRAMPIWRSALRGVLCACGGLAGGGRRRLTGVAEGSYRRFVLTDWR